MAKCHFPCKEKSKGSATLPRGSSEFGGIEGHVESETQNGAPMKSLRFACLSALLSLGSLVTHLVHAQSATALKFSCENFPRDVSETDLNARFGEGNVVSEPLFGADDGPQDGTVIFPEDDAMRLEMFWWDPDVKTKLSGIRVRGEGWESPDGFMVGTSLKDIEAKNGWPFRIRGFWGEGYPGRILSWGRGHLTTPGSGSCTSMIFLLPPPDTDVDPALRRQIGRGEYSSGHPALQAMNPVAYQLILSYDER